MEQSDRQPRVLVFGDDTRSFLTVVRSLGRQSIIVDAAPFDPKAPALASRYINEIVNLPTFRGDGRAWFSSLQQRLSSVSYDLLIPCCDRTILALDQYRDQLSHVRMALPARHAIPILFDKMLTKELAGNLGIDVAEGRALAAHDNVRSLVDEFGQPVLIKPRRSYTVSNLVSRGQVVVARTEPSLVDALSKALPPHEFMAEAYFDGVGVGLSTLSQQGEMLLAFQHRRLKEPRGGGGSSFRRSEALNPMMLEACQKVLRSLEYTGVCMFEFREAVDGSSWILVEINARFWGSLPLPVGLGVDFPYHLFELLTQGRRPTQPDYPVGVRGRNLMIAAYDTLVRDKGTARGWGKLVSDVGGLVFHPINVLIGREKSDVWVLDDVRPAFAEVLALPRMVREKREKPSLALPGDGLVLKP